MGGPSASGQLAPIQPTAARWSTTPVGTLALTDPASELRLTTNMDFSVFFAGTGGSVPTYRRGLPALLISRGGERILVDCGEGTQRQLLRSVGLTDVDEIYITHLHS